MRELPPERREDRGSVLPIADRWGLHSAEVLAAVAEEGKRLAGLDAFRSEAADA